MAIRSGSELAGLAVMTLAGGERQGRLHDVVFVMPAGRVVGFLVDIGGLFSKPRFLPASEIRSVGADAVTITGTESLGEKPSSPGPDEYEARSLEGRPVLSANGSVMGKVFDVLVDADALTVAGFSMATGVLTNALHGKPRLPLSLVQTIGKDSIVVPDNYDPGAAEYHGAVS